MGKHGNITKVTVKKAGLARLRTDPAVMADLLRRGKNIQNAGNDNTRAAGYDPAYKDLPGMELDSGTGKGSNRRARVSVRTATRAAMEAEATDRALSRAIQAGRG